MADFVERKPDPGIGFGGFGGFGSGAFILFLILILLVFGVGFFFI